MDRQRCKTYIEENERDEEPSVSPAMRVEYVEAGCEQLIGGAKRTVRAVARCLWIGEVSASRVDERLKKLRARLAGRWHHCCKFKGCTTDVLLSNG